MPTPLSASVVGGGMGGRLSLAALHASEHFELVALADIDPAVCEELAAEYPSLRTFASHEELFAACPTDVVCVATYPPTHEPIALAALALPLQGLLVEKPLADTTGGGRRILEAVKAKGIPLAVPHGLLVSATPLEILERVRGGAIGALRLVEIQCSGWDLLNAGVHWLNYFVTLTGCEPLDHVLAVCDASTRTYRDGMQVETVAVTTAQTASGVRVVMHTGDHVRVDRAGAGTQFRLVGTAGQIAFWPWENGYRLLNAQFPAGERFAPSPLSGSRHQRHLERLAGQVAAAAGGASIDYTIAESSLLALEICEAAYVSSRHRCRVTFPLEAFQPPPPSDWDPGRPYSGGGGRDGRRL